MTSSIASVEFSTVAYNSQRLTAGDVGAHHPVQVDDYCQQQLAEEVSEDIAVDKTDTFVAHDIKASSNDECVSVDTDVGESDVNLSSVPLSSLAGIPFIDTDSSSACDSDSDSVLTVKAAVQVVPNPAPDFDSTCDIDQRQDLDQEVPEGGEDSSDMSVMFSSIRCGPVTTVSTPTSGTHPGTPLLRSALKKQGSRRCLQVVINEEFNTYHELRPELEYDELRFDSFSDSGGDESDEFHESDELHEGEGVHEGEEVPMSGELHGTDMDSSERSPPFQLSVDLETSAETLSPPEPYKDRVVAQQTSDEEVRETSEDGKFQDSPAAVKESAPTPPPVNGCCQCTLNEHRIAVETVASESGGSGVSGESADCEGRRNLPDVVCVDGSLCGCLHHHHHHHHQQQQQQQHNHHPNQHQTDRSMSCALISQQQEVQLPCTPQHSGSGILKGGRLWNESPSSPSRRSVRFSGCVEENKMAELPERYNSGSSSDDGESVCIPEEFQLECDMAALTVQETVPGNGADKESVAGDFWCVQHVNSSDSEMNSTITEDQGSGSQNREIDGSSHNPSPQLPIPKMYKNSVNSLNPCVKKERIEYQEYASSSLTRSPKTEKQIFPSKTSHQQPSEQPQCEKPHSKSRGNCHIRGISSCEGRLPQSVGESHHIKSASLRGDPFQQQSRSFLVPADVRQWRMTPPPTFNRYNDPDIPPPPPPPHGARSLSPVHSSSSASLPTAGSRLADARRQFVSALTGASSTASLHCFRQKLQRRPIDDAVVSSENNEFHESGVSDSCDRGGKSDGNGEETGSLTSSCGVVSNDSYSLDDIDDGLRSEPTPSTSDLATDQRSISPPSTVASSSGSTSGYSSNSSRQMALADTDCGSGDELERFVAVQAGRTARLRQRYGNQSGGNLETTIENSSVNSTPSGSIKSPEDDGGFLRRPSVRSIRPRFGSTQQIFQQLQQQQLAGRSLTVLPSSGFRQHQPTTRNISPIHHRISAPTGVRHHGSVPVLNVGAESQRKQSQSLIGVSCGTSPMRRNRLQSPSVGAQNEGYVLAEYTPPLPPRDSQIQCTSRTAVGNRSFQQHQSPAPHYRSTPNLCPIPNAQYCTGSLNRNQTPPTPHPRTILPGVKYHQSPISAGLAQYTPSVSKSNGIVPARPNTLTTHDIYNIKDRYMHDV